MMTSALVGPDLYSGNALELVPRFAFLANHGPEPIAHRLPERNQLRPVPPLFVIQIQQLAADHQQPHEHQTAQDAEQQSEDTIHHTQSQASGEVAQQHADDPADQQDEHQYDQAPDPWRHVGVGQQATQVRFDAGTHFPSRPDGDDPKDQGGGFTNEPAQQANDG